MRIGTMEAGRLSALVFRPDNQIVDTTLGLDEIQVEIKAVGINMVVCTSPVLCHLVPLSINSANRE